MLFRSSRMSLAQHLLLRGLIAWFWRTPCQSRLVRWGTDIHDRWMLPHFCQIDFADVITDLCDAGLPFEAGWFAPHFEFRFLAHGNRPGRHAIEAVQVSPETPFTLDLRAAR